MFTNSLGLSHARKTTWSKEEMMKAEVQGITRRRLITQHTSNHHVYHMVNEVYAAHLFIRKLKVVCNELSVTQKQQLHLPLQGFNLK